MIKQNNSIKKSGPDFNPMSFLAENKSESIISRIHAMPDYLNKYWNLELLVCPGYFKFVENGYKTDKEKEIIRNYWLPFLVAIVSAFFTNLFIYLFI